jgi:hypothetical protein
VRMPLSSGLGVGVGVGGLQDDGLEKFAMMFARYGWVVSAKLERDCVKVGVVRARRIY